MKTFNTIFIISFIGLYGYSQKLSQKANESLTKEQKKMLTPIKYKKLTLF